MPNWKKIIISGSDAVLNSVTASNGFFGTASWARNVATASLSLTPISVTGSTLYSSDPSLLAGGASRVSGNIFLGIQAGQIVGAGINNSVCLGFQAGYFSTNTITNTNFIGQRAGYIANNASSSNFFGYRAGASSTTANNCNFFGFQAGLDSTTVANSNFFGQNAGSASFGNSLNFFGLRAGASSRSPNSNFFGEDAGFNGPNALGIGHNNFIGTSAGMNAPSGSYSTFIGFQAGMGSSGVALGSNNIIIGTNITLANASSNALNIGGVLFGTGLYSNTGIQSSGSQVGTGRIGINKTNPDYTIDVSGSGNFHGNVIVTGSLSVIPSSSVELFVTNTGVRIGNMLSDIHSVTGSLRVSGSITGSLFGTASNAISASWAPGSTPITFYNGNANTSYTNLSTLYVSGSGVTISNPSAGIVSMSIATGTGGGSTSPAGIDTSIQFKSGSVFGGSNNLLYEHDLTTAAGGRISYNNSSTTNADFAANSYSTSHKASLVITNDPNNRKQTVGIVNLSDRLNGGSGATTIFRFDGGGASGGGASLKVLGFKADYCLALSDGTYMYGTKTGTLWGSWDYDYNVAPTIYEIANNGETTIGQLSTSAFTLVRNATDVELQLDVSLINGGYSVYWNLLVTVFSQTLIS